MLMLRSWDHTWNRKVLANSRYPSCIFFSCNCASEHLGVILFSGVAVAIHRSSLANTSDFCAVVFLSNVFLTRLLYRSSKGSSFSFEFSFGSKSTNKWYLFQMIFWYLLPVASFSNSNFQDTAMGRSTRHLDKFSSLPIMS